MSTTPGVLAMLAGVEWLRPAWLFALLPVAWLIRSLARAPHGAGSWDAVVSPHLLPLVVTRDRTGGRGTALAAVGVGLVVAVVALAGPALRGNIGFIARSDAMRVLVVDLSPTTDADGGARLERIRLKLLDLLQLMPPGETALVAYADEPYLVAPATTDTRTLALLVPELAPDAMPVAGDRPDRALRMAARIAGASGAKSRDVVWIRASGSLPESTLAAAGEVVAQRARISVLDAGAASAPSDATVRALAERSGGVFLGLSDDGGDVRAVARALAAGDARATDALPTARPREFGVWLLPLLLPLAAFAFRRGVLFAIALPLLFVAPAADAGFADLWLQPDRHARRVLDSGDAARAAELFEDPRWRAVAAFRAGRYDEAARLLAPFDDATSHYNRGNALARLDRLADALAAFDAALKLRPDDPDIRHNRDVVHELLQSAPPRPEIPDDDAAPALGGNAAPPPAKRNEVEAHGAPPLRKASVAHDVRQREADLLAEQWLRSVPDEPGGLLRRKLMLEHRRREAGTERLPWD